MKQIIVVKPNSLDEANKKLLTDAGIVLIEHENPNEVRVITQVEGLEGDDVFNCAIDAIRGTNNTDLTKILFAKGMLEKFVQKRGAK